MDLIVIPTKETPVKTFEPEELKDQPKEMVEYKAPKVRLSENIRNFDKRPKVYTENPYSYNAVSLNTEKPNEAPTATAEEMITNPMYSTIGKFLGVDTIHDWNKYYDKVFAITQWAKQEAGVEDLGELMTWISDKARTIPSVGNKNIDNLYLFARLSLSKK